MREMRAAILALLCLGAGEVADGEKTSPSDGDTVMPARARVTEGSPSRSCECKEFAVEETADGTGEVEGGVMCGRFGRGVVDRLYHDRLQWRSGRRARARTKLDSYTASSSDRIKMVSGGEERPIFFLGGDSRLGA